MFSLLLSAAMFGLSTGARVSTHSDQSHECRHRVPLVEARLRSVCIETVSPDDVLCGDELLDPLHESKLQPIVKLYIMRVSEETRLSKHTDLGYLQSADEVRSLVKSLQKRGAAKHLASATLFPGNGRKCRLTIWPRNDPPWLSGSTVFYPMPPAEGITALGLSATPAIGSDDDHVELDLRTWSEFLDKNRADQRRQRSLTYSHVTIPDGEAVVLLGPSCPDNQVSAFPVLAQLPFIGDLCSFPCVEKGRILLIAAVQIVDEKTARSTEFQNVWATRWDESAPMRGSLISVTTKNKSTR
jgi:hypothetical protein